MLRSRFFALGLVAALLGAAGCGSSKSSSSSASTAASPPATTGTGTVPAKKTGRKHGAKRAHVPSRTYRLKMTGKAETPAGASKGSGRAVVTLRGKTLQVCWTFKGLKGFKQPTAAHIHIGARGTSGNIVVPLSTGPAFQSKGCVPASAALIRAIAKHPHGYYVNIHSKKYPSGAVRSQL